MHIQIRYESASTRITSPSVRSSFPPTPRRHFLASTEYHPAWSENMLANREATVTIGSEKISVNTTLLTGKEAESAFERFVEYNPT